MSLIEYQSKPRRSLRIFMTQIVAVKVVQLPKKNQIK